jgi:hypothetical protein
MSDMPSVDQELEQLRAENARLRATQYGSMVRVTPPKSVATMPTQKELTALLTAVQRRWPKDFEAVEIGMFTRAFQVLASFHRTPEPNKKHYSFHWKSVANERLAAFGKPEVDLPAFLAASLAWSDIPIVDWRLKSEGILLEFGLNEYVGRLPKDEWRRTLASEFPKLIDKRPKTYAAPRGVEINLNGRVQDPTRFCAGNDY